MEALLCSLIEHFIATNSCGGGLEIDRKYHILHDFGTSTRVNKKSSDHFKDLHNLKLLTNFDVNLTSSPGVVMN